MSDAKDKNYEEMLYSLTVLYERWLADKEDLNKQVIKVEKLSKDLAAKVAAFGELSEKIGDRLVFTLKESGDRVARDVGSTIKNHLLLSINDSTEGLKKITADARQELNRWQNKASFSAVWSAIIGMISAFFISCIVVWVFAPTPTVSLTNQQSSYMASGEILERIFPKLTPDEQKHLRELTDEILPDMVKGKK